MIGYNQTYNASDRIGLFQGWLGAMNWTLGKDSLTESELKILSYFLYYNDKYKSITEEETRYELLFSNSIKKKIKEEFKVDSQKLETYLNKLRKKKAITANNYINPRFVVYPEDTVIVSYTFKLNSPRIEQQVVIPEVQPTVETYDTPVYEQPVIVDTLNTQEEIAVANTGSIWDRYMNDEPARKVVKFGEGEID
jgi:hypothetical protein